MRAFAPLVAVLLVVSLVVGNSWLLSPTLSLQSELTGKVTEPGSRVPGDLRFSLFSLVCPFVSYGFPLFSTLAILVSCWFPCFGDPGDLIYRSYDRIRTVERAEICLSF